MKHLKTLTKRFQKCLITDKKKLQQDNMLQLFQYSIKILAALHAVANKTSELSQSSAVNTVNSVT